MKYLLFFTLLISCSPMTITTRQYGLNEYISILNEYISIDEKQIIKIDTIQYGLGYVKTVTYKTKHKDNK